MSGIPVSLPREDSDSATCVSQECCECFNSAMSEKLKHISDICNQIVNEIYILRTSLLHACQSYPSTDIIGHNEQARLQEAIFKRYAFLDVLDIYRAQMLSL